MGDGGGEGGEVGGLGGGAGDVGGGGTGGSDGGGGGGGGGARVDVSTVVQSPEHSSLLLATVFIRAAMACGTTRAHL